MAKTTVFLTGATGTMGFAGMMEILKYPDQYELRILARPSKKNKELLNPLLEQHQILHVIWGDLTKYEDVLKGVTGADIVLHVGGMVSPQADYRPKATLRTNITAAEYLTKAVLAQPEDQQPKVVYIGSVAQMGDRREPLHWGRAGLKPWRSASSPTRASRNGLLFVSRVFYTRRFSRTTTRSCSTYRFAVCWNGRR